jgi:Fe-S cluster biosynthesis and repair protein YggX
MNGAGFPLPEVETVSKAQNAKPLDKAPLSGAIGNWILENVDSEMWNVWIGQGTKVINELRLDFSREEDQKAYEDYMIEFLGVPSEVVEEDRKASTS